MAFYRNDPELADCLKGLLDRFEKEGQQAFKKILQSHGDVITIKLHPHLVDMGQGGTQTKIIIQQVLSKSFMH